MAEIRDIKPPEPMWQKRRVDKGNPRPDDAKKEKKREHESGRAEDEDKPHEGQIDEYA